MLFQCVKTLLPQRYIFLKIYLKGSNVNLRVKFLTCFQLQGGFLLSDDHPHGSETAQDPVEPPVVVVVVVIVIVGPVGRHQGAAVGHLNSLHLHICISRVVRMSDSQCRIVATVLGSISASSDTVESEGRQMKQCWISYIKKEKIQKKVSGPDLRPNS